MKEIGTLVEIILLIGGILFFGFGIPWKLGELIARHASVEHNGLMGLSVVSTEQEVPEEACLLCEKERRNEFISCPECKYRGAILEAQRRENKPLRRVIDLEHLN